LLREIAITPHRIVLIGDDTITFKYKDYADGNKQKQLCLMQVEFIRRYEQHILPRRFVKIRHAPSHSSYTQTITVSCSNAQSKNTYAVASATTHWSRY